MHCHQTLPYDRILANLKGGVLMIHIGCHLSAAKGLLPPSSISTEVERQCHQCLAYVKLVHIPPFLLLFLDSHYCFCMISDFHAEIVKNHTTPDLLYDELSLSGVKVLRSQRHLEKSERGFDTPAHSVDNLELVWRKAPRFVARYSYEPFSSLMQTKRILRLISPSCKCSR